jgi:hypothetical protein
VPEASCVSPRGLRQIKNRIPHVPPESLTSGLWEEITDPFCFELSNRGSLFPLFAGNSALGARAAATVDVTQPHSAHSYVHPVLGLRRLHAVSALPAGAGRPGVGRLELPEL